MVLVQNVLVLQAVNVVLYKRLVYLHNQKPFLIELEVWFQNKMLKQQAEPNVQFGFSTYKP